MKRSIANKLVLLLSTAIFSVVLIHGYYCYKSDVENVNIVYQRNNKNAANLISSIIGTYNIRDLVSMGDNTAIYNCIEQWLVDIKDIFNFKYVYIYIPNFEENTLTYLFDVSKHKLGDVVKYNFSQVEKDVFYGKANDIPRYEDNAYGHTMTMYSVLYDENGLPYAIVGVDSLVEDMDNMAFREFIVSEVIFVLILLSCLFVTLLLIRKNISDPIVKISNSMKDFTENEINAKSFKPVIVKNQDEIGIMANSFNKMAIDIREYIKNIQEMTELAAKDKVELEVASKIQLGTLPSTENNKLLNNEKFDIFATMSPAKEVGGDFYDFFCPKDNKLCTIIGDVSGKGVSAALFMMVAKTIIHEQLSRSDDLKSILFDINNKLCSNNPNGMFVTVFIGILDLETGIYNYINGGHNPPIIRKTNYEKLNVNSGIALGAFEDEEFTMQSIQLNKGDKVFLYTDGVTEAVNNESELFGIERLIKNLNEDNYDCKNTITNIKSKIDEFSQGTEQFDDITMLVIERK